MITNNDRKVFQESDFNFDKWVGTASEILFEFTKHGCFYCEIHPTEEFCGWSISSHKVKMFGTYNLIASEFHSLFEKIGLWEMRIEDI